MSEEPLIYPSDNDKPHIIEGKELSLVYFMTGLTILIIATLLGFLNRLAQTGTFTVAPGIWYTLMTLHGMAAFVGWGAFTGIGMIWYTMVKVLDKPIWKPELVRIAYYFFVAGFLLIIIATLYGGFNASWVFLFPLPFNLNLPTWAIVFWTLGVLLAGVGILMTNFTVLMTIRSAGLSIVASFGFEAFKPKPKDGEYKVPLPIVPIAVNAIGMIIATIPFAVLLFIFLLQAVDLVAIDSLNALVAKNTLWWFGHPIVYELLFPVAGFGYYMAERIVNRRAVGERISKLTWAIAVIIQNIIGSHHIYQDLVQPLPISISQQLLTYVITLPSLSSIFVIVATLYAFKFEWKLEVKYLYLATLGWFLAGMSGLVNATILLNGYVHNTLWVVGHFHTMAILNITMMLFGISYFLIQDYSGNEVYNRKLANWAMWMKYIGAIGLVHMWFLQGLLGGLRRVSTSSPGTGGLTWLSIPFGLTLLVGIWISTYILFKTAIGETTSASSSAAVAGGD